MILTADYNNKCIVLSHDYEGYLDKSKLAQNGLHFTKYNNRWALAFYINPVTQQRLDKTKMFILKNQWSIITSDDLWNQIGHPEYINESLETKFNLLFQESSYGKILPVFSSYKGTYQDRGWFDFVDSDSRRMMLTHISNKLHDVDKNKTETIINSLLNFDIIAFIKEFIDVECERYHTHHKKYPEADYSVSDFYFKYPDKFVEWLDGVVKQNYIKVLMKQRGYTTAPPAAVTAEEVLNYLYTEIDSIHNESFVAVLQLLHEKEISPYKRADVYESIIMGYFTSRKKRERDLFQKFACAEKEDRYEVERFLNPIIFK